MQQPVAAPAVQPAADTAAEPDLSAVEQYVQRLQQSSGGSDPAKQRIIPSGPQSQRPPANALFANANAAANNKNRAPVTVPIDPAPEESGIRLVSDEESKSLDASPAEPPANTPISAPPKVGRVTIRPATEQRAAPARASGVTEINAPLETSRIPTSLKGFLDQYVREAESGSFRQQLDERILRVLVGDDDAARVPLQLVTAEQQKLAGGIIETLIASRQAHPEDPTAIGEGAIKSLSALSGTLRELSVLKVPTVALCWKVEGFGRYDEFSPPKFLAARETELIVYIEVAGFASTQDEQNWFRTSFDVTTTLIDRAGNAVAKFEAKDIVDRCRNRRNDCFIPQLIRVPPSMAPGEYVVKVTIADKLGKQVAENRTKMSLVTSL